jgi:hypothetical protein
MYGAWKRFGVYVPWRTVRAGRDAYSPNSMNSIVYIVGAIVIIAAILSFLGLR